MNLKHLVMSKSDERTQIKTIMAVCQRDTGVSPKELNDQNWNNMSNKIIYGVLNYKPRYKINIHLHLYE